MSNTFLFFKQETIFILLHHRIIILFLSFSKNCVTIKIYTLRIKKEEGNQKFKLYRQAGRQQYRIIAHNNNNNSSV